MEMRITDAGGDADAAVANHTSRATARNMCHFEGRSYFVIRYGCAVSLRIGRSAFTRVAFAGRRAPSMGCMALRGERFYVNCALVCWFTHRMSIRRR